MLVIVILFVAISTGAMNSILKEIPEMISSNEKQNHSGTDEYDSGHKQHSQKQIDTYNQFTERFNLAVSCNDKYNNLVSRIEKTENFSSEYYQLKDELISKSRECESLWLEVKLFVQDNREEIEPISIEHKGKDYYKLISKIEKDITEIQELRESLRKPFG